MTLALAVVVVVFAAATRGESKFIVPYDYPLYKQCDPAWSSDVMEKETICEVGCLMTSVSMALRYYNISIYGQPANPGNFNKWLRNNGGYLPGDELIETDVPKLSHRISYNGTYHGNTSISQKELTEHLSRGIVTIAHVRNGTHFVLMTGWDPEVPGLWAVNDPGFPQTSYTTAEIVGFRVFVIQK